MTTGYGRGSGFLSRPPVGKHKSTAADAADDVKRREAVYREGFNAGVEAAAKFLENGRFLHDDAPPKRFANEAAPGIRRLKGAMKMSETIFAGGPVTTSSSVTIKLTEPIKGARDPDYEWVPPLKDQPSAKLGTQCGECAMKFEYGKSYGYHCGRYNCPMGHGWL